MKKLLAIFVICFVLIAMHVMAHASGYGIFTQGARGFGRANASIAKLDDTPSVVFFNPALLSELDGTRVEAGTTLIFPQRSFSGVTSAETEDTVYFPSTLYLSHKLSEDFSLGFGFFNPFGLGTDWPDDWEGRYLATRSEIVTYNLRPVVAWQALPSLSVAVGVDYVYLNAELERMIDFGIAEDGQQKFSGDGDGFGYNLGLSWQIFDPLKFGMAYRSEIDIDISATTEFRVPSSLPGFIPLFPTTGASTSLTLPQQLTAGIAYDVTEALLLEFSVRWEDWTAFDQLHIVLDQSVGPPPGLSEETQQRDWHDTWAFSLGGEYKLADKTTLLAGYLFNENAVPDSTFEPGIPDSDSHLFCIGLNQQWSRWDLSASYGFQHLVDRVKNNDVDDPATGTDTNGTYMSDIHLLGLSVGYKF